ncbi:MAG: hypothetical protein Q7K44_01585 [Candidatus Liptonbacteria bacterium]|nr:hypothetical protein [Candidatus Liptonbacteria bacterium]
MKKIGGEPLPDKEGLNQSEKDVLDMNFAVHALSEDVGNSLSSILMRKFGGGLESIAPIQTYEEYLREESAKRANPDAYYDYVMGKSDPARVQEYNAKIRAFNDDLERIKREKDDQKAQAFYDEMMALLRTKRV